MSLDWRKCKFHPDEKDHLYYVYPLPEKLAYINEGWLLCPECRKHYDSQDWGFFQKLLGRGAK